MMDHDVKTIGIAKPGQRKALSFEQTLGISESLFSCLRNIHYRSCNHSFSYRDIKPPRDKTSRYSSQVEPSLIESRVSVCSPEPYSASLDS